MDLAGVIAGLLLYAGYPIAYNKQFRTNLSFSDQEKLGLSNGVIIQIDERHSVNDLFGPHPL